MRAIFARASTVYSGRIDAQLSLGDVILLVRDVESGGDGSCLVFDARGGLNPRNWAPAGSVLEESPTSMVFVHASRGERLEVFLDEVYWEAHGTSTLSGELTKLGAEREVSDLIATDLTCLGLPPLELIGREFRTQVGPIDLLCREPYEPFGLVAVEVKRRRVAINDAYQVARYLDALDEDPAWADLPPARGMLVAPSLAKNAKAFIQTRERLEFVRVSYEQLRDAKTAGTIASA